MGPPKIETPETPETPPVDPTPPPPPVVADKIDYQKLADALAPRVADLLLRDHISKLKGPQGEIGPQGPLTPLDDAAVRGIISKLPPVLLDIYFDANGDGVVTDDEILRQSKPLGVPLRLGFRGVDKVKEHAAD